MFFKKSNYQELCLIGICNLFMGIAGFCLMYGSKWIIGIEGDMAGYHTFPYAVAWNAIKNGELPFWIPNIWGGVSGFHNLNNMFYGISYIIISFFRGSEFGINCFSIAEIVIIIHLWLCSFIAAVCSVSGTFVFYFRWFGGIVSLSWGPLLLALLICLARETSPVIGKYTILSGIVFAMVLLSGLTQIPVLLIVLWAFLYLFYILENLRSLNQIKKITLKFLFSGILGVGLSAFYFLPTLMAGRFNYRYVPDLGFIASNEPIAFNKYISDIYTANELRNLNSSYMGWLSIGLCFLIFVILGIFSKQVENKERRIIKRFALLTVLFSILGGYALVFVDILYYVPFVNMIREPFLYGAVFPIAIALLGAFGINSLMEYKKGIESTKLFYNIPLAGTIIGIILVTAVLPHRITVLNVLGCILICSLLICVIHIKKNFIINILLCLIVIQNICAIRVNFSVDGNMTAKEANVQMQTVLNGIAKMLDDVEWPTEKNPFRLNTFATLQVLPQNFSVYLDVYETGGYWNPIYYKTIDMYLNANAQKNVLLRNIKYWIIQEDEEVIDPSYYDFSYVKTISGIYNTFDSKEPINVKIYKNNDYKGLAWFVYNYQTYDKNSSLAEIFSYWNMSEIDFRSTALIEKDMENELKSVSPPPLIDSGTVTVNHYGNSTISLKGTTETDGLLVIAESDAPGWQAYIDGKRTKIFSVDYDRKGIVVPAGEHEIKLIYLPTSFIIGIVITIITYTILFVIFLLWSRKIHKK